MKTFLEIDTKNFNNSLLIIDVDGTIVPDKCKNISSEIINKIKELAERNKVYLCSNGSPENARIFAGLANVSAVSVKKPFYGKVPKINNFTKTIALGDKYLTDGLFAKFIGAEFLKIKHVRSPNDSFFTKLSYAFDDLIWFILPYFQLIRPWQWIKNLLVFAPVFFVGGILNDVLLANTFIAFIAFCLASGGVYALNDIFDEDQDRLHPKKMRRPIASGRVSRQGVYWFIGILAILIAVLFYFSPALILPVGFYIILNGAYSIWLKHIAVVDILCVSVFYLLRIFAGSVAISVSPSPWLLLCVLFGSLFVIIGKRRAEYRHDVRRAVLEQYSREALDFMLGISTALAIIAYGIWSVIGHDSPYLVYSTIFVIFALFRMLNRIYTHPHEAESPELLVFKDRWIFASFLFWVIYVFFVFYTL